MAPGLLRSQRYRKNDGPGCSRGPETAARVDDYRGLRLSWSGLGVEWIKKPYLSDVAASRPGDCSGDGFVIGESTFRQVRAAHARGDVTHPRGRFALDRTALTLTRRTGYETFNYFTYWSDRAGRRRRCRRARAAADPRALVLRVLLAPAQRILTRACSYPVRATPPDPPSASGLRARAPPLRQELPRRCGGPG